VLPGPAPRLGDPPGTRYYEIPLAVQDRSFNRDGSLFYPASRRFFDDFAGPYIPRSDISPIFNPEFFGNTIVVNGRTWPQLAVEPRRYRLRLLNGCNSRFLLLKLVTNPLARRPARAAVPFWQIGSDGGFLPAPVQLDQLLLGLAERADVLVDFTGLPVGTELYLINEGPDEPFGGGEPEEAFEAADPATTGQVMKLTVVPLASHDTSIPPEQLQLPTFRPLPPATTTRRVSLNEEDSAVLDGVGPRAALLGTLDARGRPVHLGWDDPITEHPALGRPRSGSCITSPPTPTPSTSTRSSSKSSTASRSKEPSGRRSAGRPASRTPSSPTRARSPGSKPPSTSPAYTCGTATSSSTKTTR
jgi:spore coat protein A